MFALFILAVSPTGNLIAKAEGAEVGTVTDFDSLVTVKGAFLGAMHSIRCVPGADHLRDHAKRRLVSGDLQVEG